MAIKIDLTQEPYFGIIRRWVLRRRGLPLRKLTTSPTVTLHLTAEIVATYVRDRVIPEAELTLLVEAVYESLDALISSAGDETESQSSSAGCLQNLAARRVSRLSLRPNQRERTGWVNDGARRARFARRSVKGKRPRKI